MSSIFEEYQSALGKSCKKNALCPSRLLASTVVFNKHGFFNSNLLEIWPTGRALDSLKPDVTKNIISQELKQILPSCKKQWKADLIMI